MPCPHNEITIVQRSQHQSAVAAAAAEAGQSVQAYFLQAVRERMTRDGFTPTSDLWPDYTTKG